MRGRTPSGGGRKHPPPPRGLWRGHSLSPQRRPPLPTIYESTTHLWASTPVRGERAFSPPPDRHPIPRPLGSRRRADCADERRQCGIETAVPPPARWGRASPHRALLPAEGAHSRGSETRRGSGVRGGGGARGESGSANGMDDACLDRGAARGVEPRLGGGGRIPVPLPRRVTAGGYSKQKWPAPSAVPHSRVHTAQLPVSCQTWSSGARWQRQPPPPTPHSVREEPPGRGLCSAETAPTRWQSSTPAFGASAPRSGTSSALLPLPPAATRLRRGQRRPCIL